MRDPKAEHEIIDFKPTNLGKVTRYQKEPSNIGGNAPLWPSVVIGVGFLAVMLGILVGGGTLLLWAFR